MTDHPDRPGKGTTLFLRYSAACGILGPIIYTIVVFVLGILTPGYNQATQLMSELGSTGAPYAGVMNLMGFLLPGILLVIFSFGLHAAMMPTRAGLAGAVLVAIAGVAYIGEAVFSCDRECIPVTFAGSAHLMIGEAAVIVAVLAAFFLGISMRPDPRWKGYWQYTVATGVLILALLPLFPAFPGYQGAVQRLVVGIVLLWLLVIAQRAYRIVSGKP